MGGGTFRSSDFALYSNSVGKAYDKSTGYVRGQVYTSTSMDTSLSPKNVMRECVNSDEHPNTIPVILALDVTGSMGAACQKTAEALGVIITDLYNDYKDIEFMVMGVGDFECDRAPLQVSQFESDVRIAKELDKIWMEHGGGGNRYESYTAPWYFGLNHTKLDCFDKQGRKGIIITMGDEPLNPILHSSDIEEYIGDTPQENIKTSELYPEVTKKFDVFHIAIDDSSSAYHRYADAIKDSFGQYLGDRLKVSNINNLPNVISSCIRESIDGTKVLSKMKEETTPKTETTGMSEIIW